jgi:hypothetical protein
MNFLYHGSTTQNLTLLKPHHRYSPAGAISYDAIYASPSPAFAAAQAFPWSSDEGIDVEIIDEKITLVIPENLSDRLLVPISIYKIPVEKFVHTKEEDTGYTWHAIESVEVIEEVKYTSVLNALEDLAVQIKYI